MFRLRSTVKNSGDEIIFEVNNRGPIIPPDKISDIFDPMYVSPPVSTPMVLICFGKIRQKAM
jgi:signal transduction histidine kinase